jgi:hypothetical protein
MVPKDTIMPNEYTHDYTEFGPVQELAETGYYDCSDHVRDILFDFFSKNENQNSKRTKILVSYTDIDVPKDIQAEPLRFKVNKVITIEKLLGFYEELFNQKFDLKKEQERREAEYQTILGRTTVFIDFKSGMFYDIG